MTPRELLGSLEVADRRRRREQAVTLTISTAAAGAPWSKDAKAIKQLFRELTAGD